MVSGEEVRQIIREEFERMKKYLDKLQRDSRKKGSS